MIKANELRRGNWILEGGKPIRVDEIRHWYFGDAEPIELSPELLRKVDVSNFPFELFYVGGRYHIALENGSWVFIESLHQFQNLYFDLTGEELIINL